jgi:REP element-mobilizing transposase RayT
VWFATKNRKWLLDGDVAEKAKSVMLFVASERGISIRALETMVDHVLVLLEANSAADLSWYLKLLKGRSAYEVFRTFPELKIDAGLDSLWQKELQESRRSGGAGKDSHALHSHSRSTPREV